MAGFEPIHPDRIEVRKVDGRLHYVIAPDPQGDAYDTVTRTEVVDQDDMLHVGAGFNGKAEPVSTPVRSAQPAGIAAAADNQSAQFMADGARPDFALEVPGDMKETSGKFFARAGSRAHTGQGAKKAPVVLAGGMKLHQLTLSSEDADHCDAGFQVEEICRAFGVPPFMIGHTEKTTSWGSGIEQMSIGFVKYTLQRHWSPSSKSSTTSCSRPRATSASLSPPGWSAATRSRASRPIALRWAAPASRPG